jgi:hypothetical protein
MGGRTLGNQALAVHQCEPTRQFWTGGRPTGSNPDSRPSRLVNFRVARHSTSGKSLQLDLHVVDK